MQLYLIFIVSQIEFFFNLLCLHFECVELFVCNFNSFHFCIWGTLKTEAQSLSSPAAISHLINKCSRSLLQVLSHTHTCTAVNVRVCVCT